MQDHVLDGATPSGAAQESPAAGASPLRQRLKKHFSTSAKAAAVVAGLATAGPASAAIVHWASANIAIPATFAGVYVNVEAQTSGTCGDFFQYSMTNVDFVFESNDSCSRCNVAQSLMDFAI